VATTHRFPAGRGERDPSPQLLITTPVAETAAAMADAQVRPAGAARVWAGGLSVSTLVILVVLMGPAPGMAAHGVLGDAVWWYVARASGLVGCSLLAVSVMFGLLLAVRLIQGPRRAWTQGLHEFVGVLAVVFTAIHVISVLAAEQLHVGPWQVVIPFTRPDNPVAQGCGVLACYLLIAVTVTSWARASLPWRWWRRLHLLTLPLFALACVHTALAGTDTASPVVHWAGLVVGGAILFLATLRLLTARLAPADRAPADQAQPSPPVVGVPQQRQASLPLATTPPVSGMSLLVGQTTWEADSIMSLRLYAPDRGPLPRWEPGAHIELILDSGRRRQYSLCGDPEDRHSYRIAVLQLPAGRGGSIEVHTSTRAGQLITVQGPRNHFPLVPSQAYLFVAGGIGITAVLAMVAHLATTGGEWKLVYAGRSRAGMAFIDEISALGPDRVDVVPSDERGRPDLNDIIGSAAAGTAVYCCGPGRLLTAVREQVADRPDLTLHTELFAGGGHSGGASFEVELQRTGRTVKVPGDRTVLQAVRAVLPTVAASCEQGICGACRTTVLAGEPDHRDGSLSSADRAAGAMLICVSRAYSERLVLDL
jgi:ferredoxin-NADP reductase/DMSO/TMAO reductase YedYZ heme-binding membrane subunit